MDGGGANGDDAGLVNVDWPLDWSVTRSGEDDMKDMVDMVDMIEHEHCTVR